ncbi:unnamed protein product [Polarella glacialis]|uniref:Uncharacterized protein n=1 Tax=Polarella glacialis TaxID=89957 RepID=A0A813K9N0_POLGL|nr:unnamed protein product [Polarella glacialis]
MALVQLSALIPLALFHRLAAAPEAVSTSEVRLTFPAQASQGMRMGKLDGAVAQFEEEAFRETYLDELRLAILEATIGSKDKDTPTEQGIGEAFANAYTFEFSATLAGLPLASAVLGLPLDEFLDRALDPACNAFFLNALVVDARRGGTEPPYHEFAVQIHDDASLEKYVSDKDTRVLAETVAVLYLNDVAGGGELEIYNDSALYDGRGVPSLVSQIERAVKEECGRAPGGADEADTVRHCEGSVVDRLLGIRTLARLAPRKGRLVQFDGSYSHAVRLVASPKDGADTSWNAPRVSLVLEQFAFPKEVLRRIPVIKSMKDGQPFCASPKLRKRFLPSDGEPREKGMLGLNATDFHECMSLRAESGREPSYRFCMDNAAFHSRLSSHPDEL